MPQACSALVVAVLAFAACQSSHRVSDGGVADEGSPLGDASVDAGAPAGWTCAPPEHGDGVVCHCSCGIADPDCANPALIVSNCVDNQVCAPNGTCTNCGNGAVESDEQCDPVRPDKAECGPLGYAPGQVPCKAGCTWAYDQCLPLLTCGNGMLDPAELCDGTLIQPDLDCADYDRASGSLACGERCAIDTSGCYTCGDGRVEGPEACDDGRLASGDGCSGTCAVEDGWRCNGAPSSCAPICGDGRIVGREACDDANTSSNDGCSATCRVEADCLCAGSPSVCSCATLETIASRVPQIDVGDIVVDSARQPQMVYHYRVEFTAPGGSLMERGHVDHVERAATGFTTRQIQIWNQPVTGGLGPNDLVLANDGDTLRVFVHRPVNASGTFAVGTRNGALWQFVFDHPSSIFDTVRAGGAWHALVSPTQFGGVHYVAGEPGAWTRDDTLTGFNQNRPPRLGIASSGDVYIASATPGMRNTSYNLKVVKRVDATAYATEYDLTTAGSCVFPIMHQPLALPGGGMVVFEDGFNSTQRWLKAHRLQGSTWVVEDVADLSFLTHTCSTSSVSFSVIGMVTAVDTAGQPHILFASAPVIGSMGFEDHFRDATGWHVRRFPIMSGAPLAMTIDANNTTHILALAPDPPSSRRLVYARIDATAWR